MKLLMNAFIALNVWLYRVSGGRMMGRIGAAPILLGCNQQVVFWATRCGPACGCRAFRLEGHTRKNARLAGWVGVASMFRIGMLRGHPR